MNGQLIADNGADVSTRYAGINVFKRGLFSNCQAKVKEGQGRGRNFDCKARLMGGSQIMYELR